MFTAKRALEMEKEYTARKKRMRTDPEFRDEEYKKGFNTIATKNYGLVKEEVTKATRKSQKSIRVGVLTNEHITELQDLGYKVELSGQNIARRPEHTVTTKILADEATLVFDTKFTDRMTHRYTPAYGCYRFKGYKFEDTFEYPKTDAYKREVTYLHTIISWE